MRILQLCNDPGIAPDGTKGAAVHLRATAAALRDRGHDVVTFTRRPPATEPGDGMRWRPLRSADDLLAEGDFDLVYERYALGSRVGLDVARRRDRPFVLEVNAPLCDETRAYRPERIDPEGEAIEAELFREATLVAAVSEPLRRFVADRRGSDRGTVVVPNGAVPALEAAPGIRGSTLLFVGHPKPWHGAERLPAMVRELARRGHDAVRLLLVGGGPGAEAVRERAQAFGVSDRVEITGAVPPEVVADRHREAAIAVAPYPRHEFFYFCPLKLLEGMAAGLPVVTTDQGDLADLVGDGGVLVAPEDDDAFVDAVDRLLADPDGRAARGERARRRIAGRFTWGHAVDTLLGALRSAVGEGAR